jgi:hypothetical protein
MVLATSFSKFRWGSRMTYSGVTKVSAARRFASPINSARTAQTDHSIPPTEAGASYNVVYYLL